MEILELVVKPIGYVRHNFSEEEVKSSWWGVPGCIEVLPEYAEGLLNLEGFSHIIVVSYLHKVTEEQRRTLRVRHRRLLRFGVDISDMPEVGVFASDSPHRPNPIGVSVVRVIRVEGTRLYVEGLDLFDGTPVLDIKPYTPERVVSDLRVPPWFAELERRLRERAGLGLQPPRPNQPGGGQHP